MKSVIIFDSLALTAIIGLLIAIYIKAIDHNDLLIERLKYEQCGNRWINGEFFGEKV